jgi:tetratricopeptide (TPR) repeat protein
MSSLGVNMDSGFINILQKLVNEQGSAALTDAKKCKAFLADYTKNDYKKECRLILLAVEAGMAKVIDGADELAACKKAFIRDLEEEGLNSTVAADIVNALALVLRGDKTVTVSPSLEGKPSAQQTAALNASAPCANIAPHAPPKPGGSEGVAELFEKAYAADKTGDKDEAFRYFQKVAEVMGIVPTDLPGLIEAFFKKGFYLQREGNLNEAITYYKGAAFFGHKDAVYRLASLGKL